MSTNHADVADVANVANVAVVADVADVADVAVVADVTVCMESLVAGDYRYKRSASHCLIILQARGLPHVHMLLIFAVADDHADAEGMSPPMS
jgi:hypothetical protein